MQLWTVSRCPITESQGEELSTSLSTSPPWETVESSDVAPRPPALQMRRTQSSQLLLAGHALQPCHRLCCPPLGTFEDHRVLLQWWGPELHTVLKVRPHQHWIQQDNPLSGPAGRAVFGVPWNGVSLWVARARCWLLLSLLPPSTPGPFLQGCSPATCSLYWCPVLLCPWCRIH